MDTNSMKGRTSGKVSHTNPPTQLPDTKRWSHSNRMPTLLREQYIAMLQEEKTEKKKKKLCQRIKIYASLYMPCHATMCAPKLLQLFLMADGWSKATITKKGAPPPVGNPPKSCWMAAGGCWQDATCAICFTDSRKRAKDCFRAIGISQKSCEGHKYLRLSPLLQPYISPES